MSAKKRRQLVLRRSADDTFRCSVQECSHTGFQSKRGCRKHVNNLHPWFFYFENDPGPQSQVDGSCTTNIESAKKPSTTHMPTFPMDSVIALNFSAWLTAICGGGTCKSQSYQTISRSMKFLKFCACEEEFELSENWIDFCLGSPKLITDFVETLKNDWALGSSAQLSYLDAVCDLTDFRKAHGTTSNVLNNFAVSEVFLMRGKNYLAKLKRLEWSRDLDLDFLISSNSWATLEELEKVVLFHLGRFNEVIKKCKSFPLHDVPVVDLTFATRFLAVFLFLRVKGSRPMTFQFLTVHVTMFQSSKANDGFVDQKEFKTNSTYTFDSLLFDDLAVRVIDLYVDNVRPLLNPRCDYLLVTHKGTQYAKLGDAMSKLVYLAVKKYIHPTRYRQIVETESVAKLSLEDQKSITMDQKHSSYVAKVYYQKQTSRRIATEGKISREKLSGQYRDSTDLDAQISQILFQETTEILSENGDCFEDQECITESPIPCAQVIPEISVSDQVEEQNSSPSSSINDKKYRSPEESNRKLVAFSPEEDDFIRKGWKTFRFGHWTSILSSFSFRTKRTPDSIKKRAELLLKI